MSRHLRLVHEPDIVTRYVAPVIKGLIHLHSKGVIHRDLKPENIFVSGRTVKLGDFSLSIDWGEERPVTRLGTLEYM